jgi:lipopolysaccharide/colanic/teichoic acid biosynthesis glycosyltransferase
MTRGKRILDLTFALFGIAILWPLAVVVAALVRLDSPGPAFFRQQRVGWRGTPFFLWKFRTMVTDAEKLGGQITIGRDSRITRVGQWLRAWKLDELPQLINVARGEMSLVGPRPEVSRYVALYDDEQRKVLDLVPGITDPASIRYRHETSVLARASDPERAYVEEVMPDKLRINLQYAERASVWSDIGVLAQTIFAILIPASASPLGGEEGSRARRVNSRV